jgi:hypothetical protein
MGGSILDHRNLGSLALRILVVVVVVALMVI